MSSILWIDVTMLINWSGKMTGIQRVEYNLASRFAKKSNVRFFVFDKSKNKFIDFDFKHIEFKISSEQNTSESLPLRSSITQNGRLTQRIPRRLKHILRPIYHGLKNQAAKARGVEVEQVRTADISDGDTVLILSGDWSDGSFLKLLSEYKNSKNISIVQIIYDMLPALHPDYFVSGMPEQFSNYMKKILSLSDKVLAISKSTKKDIENFIILHKLPKSKVEVFRLGDDFIQTTPLRPNNLPDDFNKEFMLTVGTVEARKNHQLILDAYIEAEKRNINLPPIVIAGKRGWLIESFFEQLEQHPGFKEKFVFLQPSDRELAWLYKNCQFTIFPSTYEGWGLPVAESLFNGKMCLSSDSSSMPEIAGDLIDYFSPNEPLELLDKMTHYLNNKKELRKKESAIKAYIPTSWDESFDYVSKFIGYTK